MVSLPKENYQCQWILSLFETGQAGVREGKTISLEITIIPFANILQTLLIIFSISRTRFMIQPTTPEAEIELLENFPHIQRRVLPYRKDIRVKRRNESQD